MIIPIFISAFSLNSHVMEILEDLAVKHPAFTTQLVAVIQGRKPVVRVEFELHGEDYVNFVELLTELQLLWFEHSPHPVRICYASSLHKEVAKDVKVHYPRHPAIRNYHFLRLSAVVTKYEEFWGSLTEGKIIPMDLSGGELNSSSEIIIARDSEGLKNFLTLYATAREQHKQTRRAMRMELFDRVLGMAFGYPECCTEKFARDRRGKRPREDYIFYESIVERGLEDAVPVELRAVAHVPCDVACELSIDLGREYLRVLSAFDPDAFRNVIRELRKPTLFIDRWHHITINEIERTSISDLAVTKEEFIGKAEKEMKTKPKEVVLGSVETVPFLYLTGFLGLWWIGVDPGRAVFLCNAETRRAKLYEKHGAASIADLRIYRYR